MLSRCRLFTSHAAARPARRDPRRKESQARMPSYMRPFETHFASESSRFSERPEPTQFMVRKMPYPMQENSGQSRQILHFRHINPPGRTSAFR